jgi:uncharacterized iron-regulated protein
MKFVNLFLIFALLPAFASAAELRTGDRLKDVSLKEAVSGVRAGDVVLLGEQHGTETQPRFQLQVMQALRAVGLRVSVGMEFFDYTTQSFLDDFRSGKIPEDVLLADVKWGQGFPFSSYRAQVLFPKLGESFTVALNAPMSLTGLIAKNGLASLTPEQRAVLPPDFTLGNDGYKARFAQAAGGHIPDPRSFDNWFTAQSAWDDTMAWKAAGFLKEHPEQVLVIVVGQFHVDYGGGLPDRLRARGVEHLTTFSLINLHGEKPEEVRQEIDPSPQYGPRADYLWTDDYLK